MTAAPIPGFLTKKEVEELYGRSHRSLTRDFSSAVRVGDAKVLTHLKVRTDDGKVREGTHVTLEQIQELSNTGLTPTWYIEGAWAEAQYGIRSKPVETRKRSERKEPKHPDETATVLSDESQLVRRLEDQIKDLQRDKEKLYAELTIKNEQIQQANERSRESNVLMKELQTLLGNVQERALLPLPMSSGQGRKDSRAPTSSNASAIIDAGEAPPAPPQRKKTKQSGKGRARAKRGTAKKSTTTSGKQPSSKAPREAPTNSTSKPKWYETPTLKRLLSRTRR